MSDNATPRSRRPKGRKLALFGLIAALVVAVPIALASHDFTDVPDSNPFHGDIAAIKRAGITSGKTCVPPGTPPTYCPQEGITREAMAAFIHRGFGRVAWARDTYFVASYPAVGQGAGIANAATVGTVSINTGGAAGGTQFVSLHGKLALFTNSAIATACPTACTLRIDLVDPADPGTVLDDALWRPKDNSDGTTISLDAVDLVPTATTKTYRLRFWYESGAAQGQFNAWSLSLVAQTFPFGSTGTDVLPAPPSGERAAGSPNTAR